MVAVLGRDNPHIVASSHQMQLAAEVTTKRPVAIANGPTLLLAKGCNRLVRLFGPRTVRL
jgi:hypothetical protein